MLGCVLPCTRSEWPLPTPRGSRDLPSFSKFGLAVNVLSAEKGKACLIGSLGTCRCQPADRRAVCGDGALTAEEGPVVPVGGGQLADVLCPVAHDARQVAGVAQAPHGDAVQVHGLDEVAEEGALQPQHVPPVGRRASAEHGHSPGSGPPTG